MKIAGTILWLWHDAIRNIMLRLNVVVSDDLTISKHEE